MIPFNRPSFDEQEKKAAIRVIESGFLTQGPEVVKFEEELAAFLSSPYVVAVDNCTNALFLALQYYFYGFHNATVGVPAMTFASVAHVVKQLGHGIDWLDEYHAGSKYQIQGTKVWDCAHEISRGMYEPGTIQCFSFYPNKILSSAEGGAIATDDKIFYDWLLLARNNGRAKMATHDYTIEFAGWKMNMTDLQAAIAREQLKKLDQFNARRKEIAETYRSHFKQLNHGDYLFVITVANREEFMRKMLEQGVELSYHYKPLYDQPAYKTIDPKNFPYLESIKNQIVTLPIYPAMTDDEVQTVIKLTKQYAQLT